MENLSQLFSDILGEVLAHSIHIISQSLSYTLPSTSVNTGKTSDLHAWSSNLSPDTERPSFLGERDSEGGSYPPLLTPFLSGVSFHF